MLDALKIDVCIVGAGPAGTSTALHLAKLDPRWCERTLLVEGKSHPREKLCGGGITPPGDTILQKLGVKSAVPSLRLAHVAFRNGRDLRLMDGGFRVVRRREFDAGLADEVRKRGFRIIEHAPVRDIRDCGGEIEVVTDQLTIHAKVVVAADGAKSTVRQKLRWPGISHVARLLEVLTPVPSSQMLVDTKMALFDFSPLSENLFGYYWDFPCLEAGAPHINSGVFDSQVIESKSRANLPKVLREGLRRRRFDPEQVKVEGAPIRWFHPEARCSRPHVLLAGDAAGADVMLGEGISFALGYGEVAAEAISRAFHEHDFGFVDYDAAIRDHWLLRTLVARYSIARAVCQSSDPWATIVQLLQDAGVRTARA